MGLGERIWVRADFRDLRTVLLFDDTGREFGLPGESGHSVDAVGPPVDDGIGRSSNVQDRKLNGQLARINRRRNVPATLHVDHKLHPFLWFT